MSAPNSLPHHLFHFQHHARQPEAPHARQPEAPHARQPEAPHVRPPAALLLRGPLPQAAHRVQLLALERAVGPDTV
ncbi:hypothetical protein diail_7753 [Diaporthe ilicicola]|nr:hypothetical protein diail_7753 [Diaporthe ilicicola]